MTLNSYGQPVGDPLPTWTPRPVPPRASLVGRYCRLEPLNADLHGKDLAAELTGPGVESTWTYLGVGPFDDDEFATFLRDAEAKADPLYFAVVDATSGTAKGLLSLMRLNPANGVIEIGWVVFGPRMQRTRMSTEAHFLLLQLVFDRLGYRRCEWKCDSLNAPSRAAAERLGFRFEGRFHHAVVYKGRNRDTDWLALLDDRWPARRAALDAWLNPENFDSSGHQIAALERG